LESRNKIRTTKKKKESETWIYKVPTEYVVGIPPPKLRLLA
jgi:hypothetical protein